MVKIPELAEDGQNWKIYRAKLLEVAATQGWLCVLAGEPFDGTYNWQGYDALLHELFNATVPINIYVRLRHNTAHQVFKYLAKRFRDREPIRDPHANELQCAGTATAAEMPKKSPTSTNAATERHAHAKLDEEDLTTSTKALTQGTEDVDDGNVRRIQDPRTSSEDSAKGTSAKCKETTSVILKSTPHKMQDQPQDSLQATPYACEQEAVDSVVTAECMNGTAEIAKPTIADVDRIARLGVELASEACGVDEGDGMEREGTQLQQTNLLCGGTCQCNVNAMGDLPSAHRLPLEGEWTVYPSGEMKSPNGGAGREVKPADVSNESEMLVTLLIELEVPDDGDIPYVHLGGTSWRAGDLNRPGNQTDRSEGQADRSRDLTDGLNGQMDASRMLNSAETAVMSDGEGVGTYLATGDARRVVCVTDGVGSPTDTSTGHGEVPSVEMDMSRSANAPEIVSIPRNKEKPPDLPVEAAWQHPHKPDGCRNFADTSNVHTDAHSIANEMQTAGNVSRNVRTR